MNAFELERRAFFFGVGGMAACRILQQTRHSGPAVVRQGYVTGAAEGEHLAHFRDGADVFIKISPTRESDNLAMGTQQVKAGTGIPIHRHFHMDEAFFVLKGSGTVMLDDKPHNFEQGSTIFIPRNSWHGFMNPDHELLLLWMVSPAGLEGFFRDTCNPPGAPPKNLTREQIREIALKYGTEFR